MNVNECKLFVIECINSRIALHLGMKYRLLLVFVAIASIVFLTVYGSLGTSKNKMEEQNHHTLLRLIGHRLLKSAGDSRSRVMPIQRLSDVEFRIHFEHQLSMVPDSIFSIISSTTKSSSLRDKYTAEVRDCSNDQIVYSFVMSDIDSNVIVPCLGRQLPMGCYYLNINFAASHPDFLKHWYILAGLVLVSGVFSYLYYKRKRNNSLPRDNASNPTSSIEIGNFQFHFDQRHLIFSGEKIDLTEKETKLLTIFALAPNQVIEREQLQKEVWENEGVIVARSLDVFISRLRKKLERDPGVRLLNVHGKGYKLEIAATL